MIRAAIAASYGLSVSKACEEKNFPDCSRCRRPGNEKLRVHWGCDEPSENPAWYGSCPECAGNDVDCKSCEGTNRAGRHRCPTALVRAAGTGTNIHLDLLLRAHQQYDKRNVLPSIGGWLDQTRSFLSCVDLIDSEKAYWDERMRDHSDRKRQSAEATRSASSNAPPGHRVGYSG